MTKLTMEEKQQLIRMALAAREKAYAPYSDFMVGAALRAADGRIFTGCAAGCCSFVLSSVNGIFLLPAPLQGIFSARNTAARWCTFPCSKGQQGLYTIRSLFIIHFARFETSAYIKFGYFFHAVFTKKALPYPAAAGFPP